MRLPFSSRLIIASRVVSRDRDRSGYGAQQAREIVDRRDFTVDCDRVLISRRRLSRRLSYSNQVYSSLERYIVAKTVSPPDEIALHENQVESRSALEVTM